jgi:phytoene dehydrogenase-like protein
VDAIVIGAGPNGLVAANLLADQGWSVLVIEEQDEPGGAVRTSELTVPGFHHDMFSAFYPFGAASPVIRSLELHKWGLEWLTSPIAVAHAAGDGSAALLFNEVDKTAETLEAEHPGDGDEWRLLFSLWEQVGEELVHTLLDPFPPIKAAATLGLKLRNELPRFARMAVTPVRRMSDERFKGPHPGLLLAANALHADLTPEMPPSGFLGFLLCAMAQQFGYPVPKGGASQLTAALVRRLEDKGGEVVCGRRVESIEIRRGTAVGVRTSDGESHPASKAVLADTSAVALYRDMVGAEHLPPRVVNDLRYFQLDNGTVKVDWALDKPAPWNVPELEGAGTVHIADDMDHLTMASTQLGFGEIPTRPWLVVGQMNAADPTRSPEGTSTVWAYTHVPQEAKRDEAGELSLKWTEDDKEIMAERIEKEIERHAPGFRDRIIGRHIMSPADLESSDRNLVGGAINGGTSQIHQQLILRPLPGSIRATTPIKRLYLASASAHPGGGVHGACGANAAHAAIMQRRRKVLLAAAVPTAIAAARLKGRAKTGD